MSGRQRGPWYSLGIANPRGTSCLGTVGAGGGRKGAKGVAGMRDAEQEEKLGLEGSVASVARLRRQYSVTSRAYFNPHL